MAGLDGFFKGLQAGSKYYDDTEDNSLARARARLTLNALEDTYGDNQVLRADELRNAQAQYDLDTATRSANLDTLYRTHDGMVDATNAQNMFATTDFSNKTKGLNTWGDDKIAAEKSGYVFNKTYDDNRTAGINLYGDPQNRLELARVNLGLGDYSIRQGVQDATSDLQTQTGIVQAGKQNLDARDGYYDTQTQLIINPQVRGATVQDAGRNLTNATVNNISAKNTASDRVVANTLDAKTGRINSETNLTTTSQAQPYKIRTALSTAQLETLTAEDKAAVAQVQSMVSGAPEELQDSILQEIATTSNNNKQKLAAQRLLNSRNQQRDQLVNQQLVYTNPAQVLANKGLNVSIAPDGNGYIVDGTPISQAGAMLMAGRLSGVEVDDPTIKQQGEREVAEYKASLEMRKEGLKQFQQLITKLGEDGYDEQDLEDIEKARALLAQNGDSLGGPITGAGTSSPAGQNQEVAQVAALGVEAGLWSVDASGTFINNATGQPMSAAQVMQSWNNFKNKNTQQVDNPLN